MSNTTLSTLNKYLLTINAEPPPPPEPVLVIKTNYSLFGYMDNNFLNLIKNAPGYDCIQNYNLTNASQSWMNGVYQSYTSSNVNYPNFNGFYFSTMFKTGAEAGTDLDFWGLNVDISTHNYFWNGVDKGKYTVTSSYNSSGTYIGGGTGHFFTTSYSEGSVNGEFIQLKFPYGIKVRSIGFKKRANRSFEIQYVTVLGSNNGSNWEMIANLNYSMSFADNLMKTLTVTTSTNTYTHIRMVFSQNKAGGSLIFMADMDFKFDAYIWT
jgi:hypothetical protein